MVTGAGVDDYLSPVMIKLTKSRLGRNTGVLDIIFFIILTVMDGYRDTSANICCVFWEVVDQ